MKTIDYEKLRSCWLCVQGIKNQIHEALTFFYRRVNGEENGMYDVTVLQEGVVVSSLCSFCLGQALWRIVFVWSVVVRSCDGGLVFLRIL